EKFRHQLRNERETVNEDKQMKGVGFIILVVAASAFAEIQEEYQPDGGKFLIGVRRTNVITTLSTSTITVGATCWQQVSTGTCTGKRKRRTLQDSVKISDDWSDTLESSEPGEAATAILGPEGDQEKLVIWTTSTQTITWFSSSVATGTTLTVAYSCTAAGISLPPQCG
ncbi:unnamed protein product, partial [Meganyctiphanes norvegica]